MLINPVCNFDIKVKKIVKKSKVLFDTNVRELYGTKVKNIYGQIINYATKAQSNLTLNETQNKQISELKIANRKMVEIIRDVKVRTKRPQYIDADLMTRIRNWFSC